jgi:hypothetical protein
MQERILLLAITLFTLSGSTSFAQAEETQRTISSATRGDLPRRNTLPPSFFRQR